VARPPRAPHIPVAATRVNLRPTDKRDTVQHPLLIEPLITRSMA
jgi:hypothetical protein